MRKVGQITYEFSEEEFNQIKNALSDINYYLDSGKYKEDAEEGLMRIERILEGDDY